MARTTPASPAALAALLLLAGAAAPPDARAQDDWVTVKNEMETLEVQAPPGFKQLPLKNPARVLHLQYEGKPFLSTQVKAYAYQGQTKIEHFMKFVEKDVGGTPSYEEGSVSRFAVDKKGSDDTWWVSYVEGRIEGTWGFYVECLVPKAVYDADPAVWKRVLDSIRTCSAPPETFTTPPDWKLMKGDFWAVMGPVGAIKDPKARQQLENRLFRVSSWLDPLSPAVKMIREVTNDTRKFVPRCVAHVLPDPGAFKAAAGDRWYEGAFALYLPDHAERVLVVDGSPESGLQEIDLVAEAGVQYMEGRVGRMPPWMRTAFRRYFLNGYRSRNMPGLMPPEALKKAKELFGRNPPPFEDLLKKDDAGIRALGEDGGWACWGYLQFGLHGNDGPIRNVFRKYFRDCVAAKEPPEKVWEAAVASYREETKKPLKFRDVDNGTKKYFREMKLEKEK
jgi:hypothetical protein